MKINFKPKLDIKIISIISCVVLVCLIVPIATHAGPGAAIARAIFGLFAKLVLAFIGLFVSFGATFLNTMVVIGFSGVSRAIAETGWHASRDFANMFFILIMIVIAFGTILRVEQYGVKKLLPKLIIIALLINFSLPISYIFIDFSNVAAKSFVKQVSGTDNSIRKNLIDGIKANILLIPLDCKKYQEEIPPNTEQYQKCLKQNEDIENAQEDQGWVDVIVSSIISCIFLGLAAFVLIAGAMMLVIRVLFLAILVILAPLAFMCYMLPSLGKHWKDWWSNLLKWCFFAPIFMFFFSLAINIVNKFGSFVGDSSVAKLPAMEGGFMSAFFAHMSNVLGYFLFLGLIMGGIIVAQKMGIAGADVAMKMAKGAQKKATDWAKRKGQFGGGGLLRGLGSIPILKKTWLFRRLKYAGMGLQTKSLSEKQKKRYSLYSPEDLSAEINGEIFPKLPSQTRLLLAQLASSDKYKDKIDTKAAQRVRDTLKLSSFGAKDKNVDDFEDARMDSIRDKEEIKRRISNINSSMKEGFGELKKKISLKALDDETVKGLVKEKLGGRYDAFVSEIKNQKNADDLWKKAIKDGVIEAEAQKTKDDNKRSSQSPPKATPTPPKTP